jgi:hypothetical protein
MEAIASLALAAAFAALAVFAGWRGARPPDFRRGPRMIPWRPIMVIAATVAILLIVRAERAVGLVPPGR